MEGKIICEQNMPQSFENNVLFKYTFCSNRAKVWMRKCKKDSDVESCMDKFIALYVAYAALVSSFKNDNNNDQTYCTRCVYKIIGDTEIENIINDSAIELGMVINNHPFSVLSSKGKNPQLYLKWTENQEDRLLSLLQTLYYMRCNLFHGDKNLDVAQIEILKPAISCLEEICKMLDKKLKSIYERQLLQ